MRFLIVDDVYQSFLHSFYTRYPGYGQLSYQEAWGTLMDEGIALADSYSRNLKKLGHEAEEVMLHDERLQKRWAAENGVSISKKGDSRNRVRYTLRNMGRRWLVATGTVGSRVYNVLKIPFRKLLGGTATEPWVYEILAAQIEQARPDVLLNHGLRELDEIFLQRVRPFVKLIVGQHASPLPPNVPYGSYDLMLSSLPNLVDHFRRQGVKSEYFRLGFEPSVLDRLGQIQSLYSVSFVGGYSPDHRRGYELFEQVANEVPVDFWGYGADILSQDSPILRRYHGEAWGMDMYRVLAQSRVALNRHIAIAESYANNMRLYEATGVGTLLITDMKDNLNDLFEVGKEVVAYHDAQECVELVKYYLEHENERSAIAKAGQQRTLREHTYYHRMQELVEIVKRYLP